jgi:signal peptidase I
MRPWVPPAALALALSPLLALRPVAIQGHSMAPGLRDGSLHLARRAWLAPAPARGEVWVVDGPDGPSVKRVVGLPGETIRWDGPDLWVGDRRLVEPWVAFPDRVGAGQRACGDGFLLLGDNRPQSRDGRAWGPLPRAAFRARVQVAP